MLLYARLSTDPVVPQYRCVTRTDRSCLEYFHNIELIDKQGDRIQENNWLRDNLPRLLEQSPQQKIYSRVMTFGYNADVWMTKSVADLEVPVNNLIWYLETERHQVREIWYEASIMLISCRIPKDHFSL